jgi:hypothetical protein
MESGSQQLPLKVCRHCSVASRTESATCPSCGQPYARRSLQWRWWYAIPIVALAFAIGYFGLSELVYDDEPATVTEDEASAIELGSAPEEVEEALGEPGQTSEDAAGLSCVGYDIEGQPEGTWLFCFGQDKLVSSAPVSE